MQSRQQRIQCGAGVQRVDAAVEAVLHAQEAGEVAAVGEDVAGHDALVESAVAVAGGGLQAHAAAVVGGSSRVHRGAKGGCVVL
jgi:seryl-tRNA(Sec) selenium transferase